MNSECFEHCLPQIRKIELKINTMKVGDVDHWRVCLFSKWHLALIHQDLVTGEITTVAVDTFLCFCKLDYNSQQL